MITRMELKKNNKSGNKNGKKGLFLKDLI